ncbi:ribonuclease HII [Candidatus Gottesmanbacteria bacterium]|nr:ribonuclease HII [Candidatus Gottesmanbacteria bacterium]
MEKQNKKQIICGIDEAGRGALAGPLVAASVILPCSVHKISRRAKTKVKDGKLLSHKQRNRIYAVLKRLKARIDVEVISARQINNRGIGWANRQSMRNLIKRSNAEKFIVDGRLKLGRIRGKTDKIKTMVDADATVPETILAGIVAKVYRDKIMRALHKQFPEYRWKSNAGYGTARHLEAIRTYNITYYHRNIFVTTALRNHP